MSQPSLRVAVVTTSYPLSREDVAGAFIARMLRHLPKDIAPIVVTPCRSEPIDRMAAEPPPVRCFRYGPRSWQTLAYRPGGLPVAFKSGPSAFVLLGLFVPALFLAALRAARRSDLIHANWSATGAIAGFAGLVAGTPTITTLRGADVSLAERSVVWRLLLRTSWRYSQRFVAVGKGLQEQTARLLGIPPERIEVIPNGIAPPFFAVPPVAPGRRLRLVSVGLLIPRKGIDTLLLAMSRIERTPAPELTLVGDGQEQTHLERMVADLSLSGRVRFAGRLPASEIPAVLAQHDALVLASRSEGRPNVVGEAMAAGRAVVASAIPGVCEIAEHGRNALLFPSGDATALATQLRRLVDEPALTARLGAAGRASVAGLTWERTGNQYAALYRDIVAHKGHRCAA